MFFLPTKQKQCIFVPHQSQRVKMAKILVNDGIHPTGEKMLKEAGHEVSTANIPNEDLPSQLNNFDAICVRSATKVRKDLIDQCPNLKVIARGGVGLDNIDVAYAREKGLAVYNTPAASSRSVAELAMAHMMNLSRGTHLSNRQMPSRGVSEFKVLKKSYSKGQELENKTLGIIGFGRIGRELASIAFGTGMNVLPVDLQVESADIPVGPKANGMKVKMDVVSMDEMLSKADFISLHVPSTNRPILGEEEMAKMKEGVILINTARGGSIDEDALLQSIDSGKVKAAGLDVFVGEPKPREDLVNHSAISVSPHIGASTGEAQEKIGIELAEQINAYFA